MMVVLRGFRFGMVLQLAVGPVCIYIFNVASKQGFLEAAAGVAAVTLVDAIFILLAIVGAASFMDRPEVNRGLRIFGFAVLLVFGMNLVLSVFGIELLSYFRLPSGADVDRPILSSLLLTASNPLTIVFWAGMFTAKVAEGGLSKAGIYAFGFGTVLSTLAFLLLVALAGSFIGQFLPEALLKVLDGAVGVLILYFAVRMVRSS
ncbi:LysE family transporter [Paenibacillus woosongensis]|uniref:LysE family transporter n=1 Tax=Paenibacillus woosongensis TaxID=307580 RepID=A0AA95L133_9BACL|nr:LysE family transporter [Paenibacillus woosongensis]WHX47127.1 LysE family transporter [Paenibacillus woosongensis]